ncbi:uncharacterized protein LOC127566213 [Drosophila albomicans]|uniref:Uncharacterized protein LOC127566213 n=1 Tax=Drosophila albomicans TaxID=7291 RepID=A0A9C6WE65_DROAB|nr:uncharacterized protein LOC127566213 [Drosophila albomicans]
MHATVSDKVILATAVIKITTNSGDFVLARALLDSGSQINFVTEELAQRLHLRREDSCISLLGIGESNSQVKKKIHTVVKSRVGCNEYAIDLWILKSISGYQPDHTVNVSGWKIPDNIQLADPYFFKPQKIDLLIGAETFFDLLSVGQIKQGPECPILQKTNLGWIVSGRYTPGEKSHQKMTVTLSYQEESLSSIDKTLLKFWTVEDVRSPSKVLSAEQQSCEDHFTNNVRRLPSGRFEVRLPFKSDSHQLGCSFEVAKRRFMSLEKRLTRDPELKRMYLEFMEEYVEMGHMSEVSHILPSTPHYVIPHQCVLRPQSTSTKLRVVFDASCRTSTHKALNDILMVGPTIQEELFSTLLRFRLHKYALTADIKKMYRQVMVHEADRNYQLIVWRKYPSDLLRLFRLNTVTYGTAPAPFLAIRCLIQLSEIAKSSHPMAAEVIRQDFYVDDMLTGAACVEDLKTIKSEVSQILLEAGFELAKWFSNAPGFSASDSTPKPITISETDVFQFRIDDSFMGLKATKRNILSVTSRLFDPLGLLSPLIIKAKILLQELWLQKLEWDESIPLSLDISW